MEMLELDSHTRIWNSVHEIEARRIAQDDFL